jgi:hypothetical protein
MVCTSPWVGAQFRRMFSNSISIRQRVLPRNPNGFRILEKLEILLSVIRQRAPQLGVIRHADTNFTSASDRIPFDSLYIALGGANFRRIFSNAIFIHRRVFTS